MGAKIGRGMGEDRINCGESQERGSEGQENEWKSVAAGWVGGSLGTRRDQGWERLPRVNEAS